MPTTRRTGGLEDPDDPEGNPGTGVEPTVPEGTEEEEGPIGEDPEDLGAGSAPVAPTTAVRGEFKPETPKFGGISKTGLDNWVAWAGGEPKSDWSGLKDPNPKLILPNQYRPALIGTRSKAQHY